MIGDYYLGKKLGGGATAMARIGVHHETGEKVALKILWRLKEKESRVRCFHRSVLPAHVEIN